MHVQTAGRYVSINSADSPEIKTEDQPAENSSITNNKLDGKSKPSITNPSASNRGSLEPRLFLGYHGFANALDHKPVRENIINGKAEGADVLHRTTMDRLWVKAVLQLRVHKYRHVTDAEVEEVVRGSTR
jgi:hypothetical protein